MTATDIKGLGVSELEQERLLANPRRMQSLATLARAYEHSGNAALQRQACRQLVLRTAEGGLATVAPELVAARRMLEVAA